MSKVLVLLEHRGTTPKLLPFLTNRTRKPCSVCALGPWLSWECESILGDEIHVPLVLGGGSILCHHNKYKHLHGWVEHRSSYWSVYWPGSRLAEVWVACIVDDRRKNILRNCGWLKCLKLITYNLQMIYPSENSHIPAKRTLSTGIWFSNQTLSGDMLVFARVYNWSHPSSTSTLSHRFSHQPVDKRRCSTGVSGREPSKLVFPKR